MLDGSFSQMVKLPRMMAGAVVEPVAQMLSERDKDLQMTVTRR